jgi:hypothetical protein
MPARLLSWSTWPSVLASGGFWAASRLWAAASRLWGAASRLRAAASRRWVAYGLRAPLAAIPDPSRRTRILLHQAHRRPDLKRVHLRTSKWGTCTSPGLLERGIAVRQGPRFLRQQLPEMEQ